MTSATTMPGTTTEEIPLEVEPAPGGNGGEGPAIAPDDEDDAATHLSEIVRDGLAIVTNRASGRERPIITPWAGVNEHMRGGMWPGLYTLTGNTGSGKTQWAIQVAIEAAKASIAEGTKDEHPVVYVALELGKLDMAARCLGLLASLPHWEIAFPKDGQYSKVIDAVNKHQGALKELPILVKIAPPTGWYYHNIDKLADRHKPKLLVIDYAQLVSAPPGSREDIRTTVGMVAKIGRDIARRHNAVVLALCSTARANYAKVDGSEKDQKGHSIGEALGTGDPSRLVGLGKESGELEYTADCALVLGHEPKTEGATKKQDGMPATRNSWLAVAKGRGYGTGWVELRFDGSRFNYPSTGKVQT